MDNIELNFFKPHQFSFIIDNDEFKHFEYSLTDITFPSVTVNAVDVNWRGNALKSPGDNITHDDITCTFLIDEYMTNYSAIHAWLYRAKRGEPAITPDVVIIPRDSKNNPISEIRLIRAFPTVLSGFAFTTKDPTEVSADVSFSYDYYTVSPLNILDA